MVIAIFDLINKMSDNIPKYVSIHIAVHNVLQYYSSIFHS